MTKKLGDKVGQIDIHKKPKSSVGETLAGIVITVVVVVVLVNLIS